jgi:GNAT superfamily N-acetyltransferase
VIVRTLWARWRRPALLGLSLVGAAMIVGLILYGDGSDFRAYWSLDPGDPYGPARNADSLGGLVAFRYAPPIASGMAPLGLLPFDMARLIWLALGIGCVAVLARRWALAAIAFYPVALELGVGNVHLELALAVFLGFRWPAAWAFVLLTKVTPGVGLLWFAVRREWRSLGIALGATAAIAAVSFAITPDLWRQWVEILATGAGQSAPPGAPHVPIPLILRLPVAAALVAWGASTDRRWTVAVAATLALPTIWPQGLALLLGSSAVGLREQVARGAVARHSKAVGSHPSRH